MATLAEEKELARLKRVHTRSERYFWNTVKIAIPTIAIGIGILALYIMTRVGNSQGCTVGSGTLPGAQVDMSAQLLPVDILLVVFISAIAILGTIGGLSYHAARLTERKQARIVAEIQEKTKEGNKARKKLEKAKRAQELKEFTSGFDDD